MSVRSLWAATAEETAPSAPPLDGATKTNVAIIGGVLVSILVGGGLMALVFYSNRHGYDDLSGGDSDPR